MNTNSEPDALRSRWTLEGTIPLTGVAEGASWRRARSVATGQSVVLYIVHGDTALEAADAVRRAYLVDDPHLLPVQEIVVLDDPRETSSEQPSSGNAQGPTTVVEYLLPPAPPLAALLARGPLHPETARAIIGEAATGLEAARRRGVRHQLLDSNRVFVDTRSGAVLILGIGVEAASHPGLDRSREVASFQDTAALVALLYRALTGRSPRHDAQGNVPRPSTVVDTEIPQDLDLLCDLVLNESADEIPETTRGLIEALEPWQSIPVTLEAYPRRAPQEPTPAGTPEPSPSDAPEPSSELAPPPVEATPEAAPTEDGAQPAADGTQDGGEGEDELLESTALMQAVPDEDTIAQAPSDSPTESPVESPVESPAESSAAAPGAGSASAAGATGAAAASGAAAATGAAGIAAAAATPTQPTSGSESYHYGSADADLTSDGSAPDVDASPSAAAEDQTNQAEAADEAAKADAADEAARQAALARAEEARRASSEAKALVTDLQLDEKRSSSPFPGHLEITLPTRPQPTSGPAAPTDPAAATGPAANGAATHPAPSSAGPSSEGPPSAARSSEGPSSEAPSARAAGASSALPAGGLTAGAAAGTAAGAAAAASGTTAAGGANAADLPSRSSGTHWPVAHGAEQADAPTLAPDQSPSGSDVRAQQPPAAPSEISVASTPDHSAPIPAQPVVHSADEQSVAPVPVSGRTASLAPVREDGPIVVHGRDRTRFDDTPDESTAPFARSSLLRDVVGVAVDADAPETFTMGPRDEEKRSLQSQWIIIGGAIVVMVALVIALTSITRDLSGILEDPLATSAPAAEAPSAEQTGEAPVEPTAEATEDPALPAPEVTGVELFAEGSDREPDHTDQQELLTDGDPATFWSTKHYGSPDYGGLKEGVGIRLNFAEPSTLTAVTLTTARNNGGTIELRAVNDDGSLGDVLSTGELAGDGEVRLETPEPFEAERVALWITELPPDSNETGRFRARIAEIQVE
ncbi:hypothetical protein [Brachybacterium sp. AOP24-D1-21]|uniref:hypothetical protein n=1 Tax=Brachybacterium sp. AOP24-D1-21 TaxID=3457711 RepID=UPI004034B70E